MIVATRCSSISSIKAHRVIHIFGYPAPFATFGSWTPKHIVVARIVEIVEVHVHDGYTQILLPIHPLGIFCQCMPLLFVELFEGIEVINSTLFQFFVFYQVDILKSVVVGNDVVLVCTLTDVQHSPIFTVDIHDRWAPGLPVDICIFGHSSLSYCIAHIDSFAVVSCIAQYYRLIVGKSRTLIREELVFHVLLAKALMAIDTHRFPFCFARVGSCDTCLTELVNLRWLSLSIKQFEVDWTAPILLLTLIVGVVVGKDSNLAVIQIFIVGYDADDGNRQIAMMEDVRLNRANRRQPTCTEQFGTYSCRLVD